MCQEELRVLDTAQNTLQLFLRLIPLLLPFSSVSVHCTDILHHEMAVSLHALSHPPSPPPPPRDPQLLLASIFQETPPAGRPHNPHMPRHTPHVQRTPGSGRMRKEEEEEEEDAGENCLPLLQVPDLGDRPRPQVHTELPHHHRFSGPAVVSPESGVTSPSHRNQMQVQQHMELCVWSVCERNSLPLSLALHSSQHS